MWATAALLAWLGGTSGPALVRSVSVEAAPDVAARVERYVAIRPGEPLDPEAVRRTVELLHATGEFADVLVEQAEAVDGLHVTLRPRPAPLLAGIRVEGQRVVDAKQVRRIARLETGDALWPARLDTAARDVALALVARGFLEARVNARSEPGEQGTLAVFDVAAGPLVRVGEARVESPAGLQPSLSALVAPRAGRIWVRARAERAAERMRESLVGLGHGRAVVELRETYDPGGARVALVFVARPGPRTLVRFEGDSLPAELRRDVEQRLEQAGYTEDALGEAADRIDAELTELGHRLPRVQYDEISGAGALEFVFTVEAGPRASVASVRVVGWPAELPEPGSLHAARAGEPLVETRLEEDVRALQRALEDAGYTEARVDLDVSESGGLLPVVYRARPGPRSVVATVELAGLPEGLPLPQLKSRAGQPLRLQALSEDRATLLAALRDAGYDQGQVAADLSYSEDRSEARLAFRVEAGAQSRVARIVIAGLEHTREIVVRRELQLREGEPLGLAQVFESQKRLAQLGLFDRVSIRELETAQPDSTSVVVDLHEAGRTALTYGIGYSERELLRGSVELTRRNLSGMNRSLSLFGRLGFRGSRLYATFREPRLFDREQELFVTGFREEEDRQEFDFIRYGGFVQTARPLSDAWTVVLRLGHQRTRTYNAEIPPEEIEREFQPSTFSGPAASLVQDTRDDPLEPRRGHFVGGDVQLSLPALGGDGYAKAFLQVSAFRPLSGRALLALNARVGVARTFDSEEALLPRPDRFYAGGDYSLRGWAIDSVDYAGGNALLLGSVELRFDVGRAFAVAAFTDAGNVYPAVAEMRLDDILYSAGLGIRYQTAVGPLRVDWGYKLNRRPGEKPHQFHFTVGHAF